MPPLNICFSLKCLDVQPEIVVNINIGLRWSTDRVREKREEKIIHQLKKQHHVAQYRVSVSAKLFRNFRQIKITIAKV